MLLTVTSATAPARDLGYLLRKHPDRLQTFDLPFGKAHVFYPEADRERCTAAMLLDVDARRLGSLEHIVFGAIKPKFAVVTTPNCEYNVLFARLGLALESEPIDPRL